MFCFVLFCMHVRLYKQKLTERGTVVLPPPLKKERKKWWQTDLTFSRWCRLHNRKRYLLLLVSCKEVFCLLSVPSLLLKGRSAETLHIVVSCLDRKHWVFDFLCVFVLWSPLLAVLNVRGKDVQESMQNPSTRPLWRKLWKFIQVLSTR